jgi:acyl carrier protein
MEQNAFLTLVADVLEVEPNTVALTDVLDDIDWDSLSNISFIAEVDTAIGATIDADDLAKATTVADLFALVQAAPGSN